MSAHPIIFSNTSKKRIHVWVFLTPISSSTSSPSSSPHLHICIYLHQLLLSCIFDFCSFISDSDSVYLHILGTLSPVVSPLLLSYSVSITIPISPWSVFFFCICLSCLLIAAIILKRHPLYPLPSAQGCWNGSACLPSNSCSRSPNADFTSSLIASKGTHTKGLLQYAWLMTP